MTREIVNSRRVTPLRSPMSHAVKAGGLVFVSGTLPFKGEREIVRGDFAAQMHQVMVNIKAVLEDAGSSLDKVVKTTVVLRHMSDFPAMNEIYRSYFKPDNYPARITMESPLALEEFLIEIDCVAEA